MLLFSFNNLYNFLLNGIKSRVLRATPPHLVSLHPQFVWSFWGLLVVTTLQLYKISWWGLQVTSVVYHCGEVWSTVWGSMVAAQWGAHAHLCGLVVKIVKDWLLWKLPGHKEKYSSSDILDIRVRCCVKNSCTKVAAYESDHSGYVEKSREKLVFPIYLFLAVLLFNIPPSGECKEHCLIMTAFTSHWYLQV